MRRLILASQSPRRKLLLEEANVSFSIVPSDLDETNQYNLSPEEYVKDLSIRKADSVLSKNQDAIVIGADTIVLLDGEIVGKPKDIEEAKTTLKRLSNRSHLVLTGVSVLSSVKRITKVVSTDVTFKKLSIQEITEYITQHNVLDKAGSYGIQDGAGRFVKKIDGDYSNIVGLPISTTLQMLKEVENLSK